MRSQIKIAISLIALISITFGMYWQSILTFDSRYAHAMEFNKLEQRVLTNEINQSYRDTRKEVYDLRALVRKYPGDEKLEQQLKEAEDELKRLKEMVKK